MTWTTITCLLALLAVGSHRPLVEAASISPVVQTSSGILRGTSQTLSITGAHNQSQQQVYKFLGVPYAAAPIGALRFKRPVELLAQEGAVLDAAAPMKTCPQHRHLARFISPLLDLDTQHQTSEDCLALNIYVPAAIIDESNSTEFAPTRKVPVIVWIPGEGFDFADARQFDGSYLATQTESIVVTVQYRVGVLGFLSAPQLGITGNMGVYDQLMALRWLHNNVGVFGGDPNQVTLMGRFSGSMSISAMITAPKQEQLTKLNGQPLFKQVALLSGVAVNDWIIEKDQAGRIAELQVAAATRGLCSAGQLAKNISCLQAMPVDELLDVAGYGWKLVVDDELIDEMGPAEAIKRNQFAGHVEAVLMGETGAEGMLCLYRHLLNEEHSHYAKLIDENKMSSGDLRDIIRDDSLTYFKYNVTEANPIEIALNALVDDEDQQQGLRDKYIDACSDFMVRSHANRFKRHLESRNRLIERGWTHKPVRLAHYELRYKPSFSLAPSYIMTAAHGDDVPLIFGLVHKLPSEEVSRADLLMSQRMMSYIGDFVHGAASSPLRPHKSIIDHNASESSSIAEKVSQEEQRNDKLRVVLVGAQLGGQLVADMVEQRPSLPVEELTYGSGQVVVTRSHRLVELHRQQTLEDNNLWFFGPKRQQVMNSAPKNIVEQQTMAASNLNQFAAGESSLVTMLLLSSCILTFGLMSFCFVFSLIIVRCNYRHAKSSASSSAATLAGSSSSSSAAAALNKSARANGIGSPSSSCNICIDDSQAECLDSVFRASGKRDNRSFCNMFAKLRDHNPSVEQPAAASLNHQHASPRTPDQDQV